MQQLSSEQQEKHIRQNPELQKGGGDGNHSKPKSGERMIHLSSQVNE